MSLAEVMGLDAARPQVKIYAIVRLEGDGHGVKVRFHRPQERTGHRFARIGTLPHQRRDQYGDFAQRQDVIDVDVRQGASRHARRERFVGILNDRHAARLFDRAKSRSAVIERSSENDPDDARSKVTGRRPKQRIDRRPHAVFRRAVDDAGAIALDG
jgi:hypothetical protein